MRFIVMLILGGLCQITYAAPPQSVIESCLLGYPSAQEIEVMTGNIRRKVVEDIPGYRIWGLEGMRLRVSYAASQRDENDYIIAGRCRGYIKDATPITKWSPVRIEVPMRASYRVVKHGTRRYACVTQANGQGTSAFVIDGYIGEFPPKKGRRIQLYYTIANTKKFKAFKSGESDID